MRNEETITYAENGDNYLGVMAYPNAILLLRSMGYTMAYSGRKIHAGGMKTLCGINASNTVKLEKRRQNGLWNARIKYL